MLFRPVSPLKGALMWTRNLVGGRSYSGRNRACSMFGRPRGPPDAPEADFHVIGKCDFMTGGGSVVAGGGRVTFGVHAGRSRGGTVFGHFTVVDHRTDTRYQSTQITAYGRAIAPFFVSYHPPV